MIFLIYISSVELLDIVLRSIGMVYIVLTVYLILRLLMVMKNIKFEPENAEQFAEFEKFISQFAKEKK